MNWTVSRGHPLPRLFAGLVEQVFMAELGVCDTRLMDYVSGVLTEFVHVDAIYRLHTVNGEVIRDVSRAEAEACLGPKVDEATRRQLINRYIGDYTLFWAGVYPESLRPRNAGVDRLGEYVLQGRRSYGIASELSDQRAEPPAELLRRLSEEFERCVHGLHRVRAAWERSPHASRRN